ncbi:MAG: YkgJ family cysteine cluster protein [Bacteroidetes bacterium]|nr:YkgJ family cysteine cluster protein [Bacteroidota bacterium]MBS1649611.1 YkgJ family cysteine cluster protein [Bacteroidota bacterium]
MLTDLHIIQQQAADKENENDLFQSFLKEQNAETIDKIVHQLNKKISTQIDCTTCGNCCKTLMINVTDEEANNLANKLNQPRKIFDENYLEKSTQLMVINKMPCHFLHNNICTVYENRFAGCKEFPALHLPNFIKRLFTVFMHYERCPIIFNVVEALKQEIYFENKINK